MPVRIVIDASVMLWGFEKLPADPTGPRVKDFLSEVRKSDVVSVGVKETFDEWSDFKRKADPRSPYTKYLSDWHHLMTTSGRLQALAKAERKDLRDRVEKSRMTPDESCAVGEDLHLIEGALAADLRIASADDRVLRILRKWADVIPEAHRTVWVNPAEASHTADRWLRAGAPAEPNLVLFPSCRRSCCRG